MDTLGCCLDISGIASKAHLALMITKEARITVDAASIEEARQQIAYDLDVEPGLMTAICSQLIQTA